MTFWTHPDLNFLQGLLDIFPFASDDLEARSALWNIMARLLFHVRESELSPSALREYVSVLASKSELIEDDLLDCQLDGLKSKARTAVVSLGLDFQYQCYKVDYSSSFKKLPIASFAIFYHIKYLCALYFAIA